MNILLVGLVSIFIGALLAYLLSRLDRLSGEIEVVHCGERQREKNECLSKTGAHELSGKLKPRNYRYQDLLSDGIFSRRQININIDLSRKDRMRLTPMMVDGDSMLGSEIKDGDLLWVDTDPKDFASGDLVVLAYNDGAKVKVRELVEPHKESGWWVTRSRYETSDCFAKHHENQIVGIVKLHTEVPANLKRAA